MALHDARHLHHARPPLPYLPSVMISVVEHELNSIGLGGAARMFPALPPNERGPSGTIDQRFLAACSASSPDVDSSRALAGEVGSVSARPRSRIGLCRCTQSQRAIRVRWAFA